MTKPWTERQREAVRAAVMPFVGSDNKHVTEGIERTWARADGWTTSLIVVAKDGTKRQVAVLADESPESIGNRVLDAIHGVKPFQQVY